MGGTEGKNRARRQVPAPVGEDRAAGSQHARRAVLRQLSRPRDRGGEAGELKKKGSSQTGARA